MISIKLYSPKEIQLKIANTFKNKRLLTGLSRKKLSLSSGIPAATIRKFEDSGEVSLKTLIILLKSLDCEKYLFYLFDFDEVTSREELENVDRKRGKKSEAYK